MTQNTPYALVIGGANIDFVGIPDNKLIWHDKNPGKIKMSLGGVGRNIAENLAKLGVHTKLLALVGDDTYGTFLLENTARSGVDTSLMKQVKNQSSSVYFSLMDTDDDMAIAMSDMAIVDLLTPHIIAEYKDIINNAQLVIIDTNLSEETLAYLLQNFPQTRFLVDTVSVTKTKKIKNLTAGIDTLKPNCLEAELLTGIKINSLEKAYDAIDNLLTQGIKHIFLSLGEKGIVYGDANTKLHIPAFTINVVNAAGAGDAMMASIAYGMINNKPIDELLLFANATAAFALTAEQTIHPDLSVEKIEEFLQQCNDM